MRKCGEKSWISGSESGVEPSLNVGRTEQDLVLCVPNCWCFASALFDLTLTYTIFCIYLMRSQIYSKNVLRITYL